MHNESTTTTESYLITAGQPGIVHPLRSSPPATASKLRTLDFLFQASFDEQKEEAIYPGRVIGQEREYYNIRVSSEVVLEGSISSKDRHNAREAADFPAVGDWVELWGNTISVSEVAKTAGSIPYQLLTSVSQRVKRILISL